MTAKTMAARTVMNAQCRVRRRLPDADRFDAVTPHAVQVADAGADFSGAAVVVVVGEYTHFGGAHAEVASAIVDVLVEARARLGPALAPHDCADPIPATPSHTTLRRKTTGRVSMRRILVQSPARTCASFRGHARFYLSVSFCTRQLSSSATYSSCSDGQAMA